MRLPPRQSTAEADLLVPFQLVSSSYRNITINELLAVYSYPKVEINVQLQRNQFCCMHNALNPNLKRDPV